MISVSSFRKGDNHESGIKRLGVMLNG